MKKYTTVKEVMTDFNSTVDNLTSNVRLTVDKYDTAEEPEKAFYVRKTIMKWFNNGGHV